MTISTSRAVFTETLLRRAWLAVAALGVSAAFLAAPAALADSTDPDPAPLPTPVPAVVPTDTAAQPVAAPASQLVDGVPHLPSPDNLPPGTTDTPPQTRSLGYLRDILHAIGNHDVSMNDALLLLAQRPMSATAGPGQSAGPSGPVGSSAALPIAPAVPTDAPTVEAPTP
ncbi:MAG TPA: hypothetical protein VIJ23_21115 [Mycobacterium sp.]